MIGKTISHYKILEKLGEGGMGVVYKAEDTKLERAVAIKFLPKHVSANDEERKRFKVEAKAAAQLNHPNIATIHAIEEVDDELFIVMEYIEGQELKKIIAAKPPEVSNLRGLMDYATQIAEGLQAAHEKGVVHRDIKSTNIMVTQKGQVKIMDFGLAKLAGRTQLTKEGTTLGTIAYMSPEQAQGTTTDQRTDIWSFGVVLYEMLSGKLPFGGDYEQAIVYSILNEAPEPIPDIQNTAHEPLQRIVDMSLAKEPEERYQNMEDVLSELRSITGDKGLVAVVSPVERHMVGREKEMSELQAGLQTVFGGRGLLMCVAGEPGIGKTTLVEGFLDEVRVAGSPCTIATGQCSERLAGTEAYLPLLEVLEGLLNSGLETSVARLMREKAPWWYTQVASLSPDDPTDARLMDEVKTTTQERTKRELATFLREASRARPLVLFFEDLHWADVSTIDMLAYLATKFDAIRLLVVCTYRPADLQLAKHPFLQIKPDLLSRGQCSEIILGFLSPEDMEHYFALEFPKHVLPVDFAKLIHSKTEGSPMFMVDLMRDLRNRGVIVEEEGEWTLSQSVAEIQLELPESMRGMIERKIDQLSEEDYHLLGAASVQGYEFDSAVVGTVLDMDEEEVEERLQALERDHRFVRLMEEEEFPDHTLSLRYGFVHLLYQNELYASLTRSKQARLSKSVAETLLRYYGEESGKVASELALLFEIARDLQRAVEHVCIAVQNAAKVFAYHEAIALARRGLALLKTLPDAQQELDLQVTLGLALHATQGWTSPEALQAFSRARELCKKVGETPRLFHVLYGLYAFSLVRADYQPSRELSEQLLHLAQRDGDSTLLISAHRSLGLTLFYMGEFVSAQTHMKDVIALHAPQQHRSLALLYGGLDPVVDTRNHYARMLWILGYPDQSHQMINEALSLARELSFPFSIAHATGLDCWISSTPT